MTHDAHHEILKKHVQVLPSHHRMYQSPVNTKVSKQQHVRYVRQNLSAQGSWGGVLTFQVNQSDFVRNCVLYLKGADLGANQTLLPNMMANAINKVLIRIGNSDQITLPASSQQILLEYGQCQSQNKRDEIARLAGQPAVAGSVEGLMILKLPFSSVNQIVGLQSYLLGSPITIDVYLNSAPGIIIGGANQASYSNALQVAQLYVETVVPIGDTSEVQMLPPSSDAFIDYFFKRAIQVGNITVASTANVLNQTTLTNLQAGRLCGILITALSATKASAGNANSYARLSDIQLQLNGQNLFNCPNYSFEMFDLNNSNSKGVVIPAYEVGGALVDAYKYYFKFQTQGIENDMDFIEISSGQNLGNNQLVFSYKTPTTDTYTLFITYVYQACIRMRGDKTVDIFNLM